MSAGRPRPLELTRLAADHLAEKGVEDARLEAELLLAHVLGVRRLDLYLQFERPLTDDEVAAYREMLRRRARREPLQYITGQAAFRELKLTVDPRVLIPRPETEVLVERVLEWARERGAGDGDRLTALDIGTGSGAIALSLALEGPFDVVATDSSSDALDLAASNAAAADLVERVAFRHGHLWEPIGPAERYHVIVSNPPYVAESERAGLMPEVRDHEPAAALFAGGDGLDLIRDLVAGAADRLRTGGLLALEVGTGQAETVRDMAEAAGFAAARVARDLTGRDRMVLAERDRASEDGD